MPVSRFVASSFTRSDARRRRSGECDRVRSLRLVRHAAPPQRGRHRPNAPGSPVAAGRLLEPGEAADREKAAAGAAGNGTAAHYTDRLTVLGRSDLTALPKCLGRDWLHGRRRWLAIGSNDGLSRIEIANDEACAETRFVAACLRRALGRTGCAMHDGERVLPHRLAVELEALHAAAQPVGVDRHCFAGILAASE